MKTILFTKALADKTIGELVNLGTELGLDGFDLCVRPGHPVNPDNLRPALREAVRISHENGLSIPLVTGDNTQLLDPENPAVEPLLGAMDEANVRLLKMGYFRFDPDKQDYWEAVDHARRALEHWVRLGERHNVTVCYHMHSRRCLGLNGGTLAHLIRDLDSRFIGAYPDAGHMQIEGEEFAYGAAILKGYLRAVAVKDVHLIRDQHHGHGRATARWVQAGRGMVGWTSVFGYLRSIKFQGPVSIHCEFQDAPSDGLLDAIKREVAFFNSMVKRP